LAEAYKLFENSKEDDMSDKSMKNTVQGENLTDEQEVVNVLLALLNQAKTKVAEIPILSEEALRAVEQYKALSEALRVPEFDAPNSVKGYVNRQPITPIKWVVPIFKEGSK
jgi:hypothetical protein